MSDQLISSTAYLSNSDPCGAAIINVYANLTFNLIYTGSCKQTLNNSSTAVRIM